jgi:hypothetical protein
MYIKNCRVCGSDRLEVYFDLGKQPWCNDFLTKEQLGKEKKYPLEVCFCFDCGLSQLTYTVPKEVMYSKHTYVSGTTKTLSEHFYNIAEYVTTKFDTQKNDLIFDIGSNDGTQLLQYRKLGFTKLLGVESAANIAEIAKRENINTIVKFFNHEVATNIVSEYGKAKIISAAGVFFHLEELHSVCEGIEELLDDDGIFVVQFIYLVDMLEHAIYDVIYHEHLLYYTVHSINNLLAMYKLKPVDAFRSPIHGGSVVMCFMKTKASGKISKSSNVYKLLTNEVDFHLGFDIYCYKRFAQRSYDHSQKLIDTIEKYKHAYNVGSNVPFKIRGYGAPAKGNTLLNYCRLDIKSIELIEEANRMKCGLYTPGSHIPIIHYSEASERPEVYLVLSHNFLDEFLNREKEFFLNNGVFIVPFPKLRTIEKYDLKGL